MTSLSSLFTTNRAPTSPVLEVNIASVAALAGTSFLWQQGTISSVVFASTIVTIALTALYQLKNSRQLESSKIKPFSCDFTEKRPEEVNRAITSAFQKISTKQDSTWCHNGESSYRILYLNECRLIRNIIGQAPADQKTFYIVDLGAGDFTLGKTIAEFFKKNKEVLNRDQKVTIISVRGESNKSENIIDEGNVIRCNLGAFEIENLNTAFAAKKFSLESKVDLVVSSWTFRHLVDPIGTLVQTYQLLRPETGLLLMDGFFPLDESDQEIEEYKANSDLKQILTKLKAPVLLKYDEYDRDLIQFALRRPSAEPCPLKKEYAAMLKLSKKDNSSAVTEIARFKKEADASHDLPNLEAGLYGDQDLFHRLAPIIRASRK